MGKTVRLSFNNTISSAIRRTQKREARRRGGTSRAEYNHNFLNSMNSLREIEMSITELVTPSDRFSATIKKHVSDFQVNEIGLDGNLIKLTNKMVPLHMKLQEEVPETENVTNVINLEPELNDIGISHEKLETIKQILTNSDDVEPKVEVNVTELTKEQRVKIYSIISKMFQNKILTSTYSKDGERFIYFTKARTPKKQLKKTNKPNLDKWLWPNEYLYFVMYKENMDVLKAASLLGFSVYRSPYSTFMYAGSTDKRGTSVQLCCSRKRNPESLLNVAKRTPRLEVGNFHFKSEPLQLGELKGHRYRMAFRNALSADNLIISALESFQTNGFINYFGLQRFGNAAEMPSYDIGRALLKEDWKLACEIIMTPREHDLAFVKKMKSNWLEQRDAALALDMLASDTQILEAKVLMGLVLFGKTDFFSALDGIPLIKRQSYIEAYQSLIWNKIVTRRIKEQGLQLCVGDLVCTDKSNWNLNRFVNKTFKETEEGGHDYGNSEEIANYKTLAKPVTKQEIASGKYTIHDLVLPMPGFDILYPNNDTKNWYIEILTEGGLTIDSLKHNINEYSLMGEYRRVLVKPESVKWSLVEHEPNEILILSDFDAMLGKTLERLNEDKPQKFTFTKRKNSGNDKPNERRNEPECGRGVILQFDLPATSYTTQVLREILEIRKNLRKEQAISNAAESAKRKLDDENFDVSDPKRIKSN